MLSGADLLYWRRKREQWRQLAEGAPDDAPADYLHRYFEPTARAIDGLEKSVGWARAARSGARARPSASRRTTSAGCGRPRFALPILRTPPMLTTATPSTMNRKPAHDRVPSISTTHRRSVGGTAPRHPSRARPCPRHHRTAAPGEDPGQRRRRRPPSRVSRTFIYTNADAKTAVSKAIRETSDHRRKVLAEADAREAGWRERALNAEDALKVANAEVLTQRTRLGELLGRIRDLEAEWTQDAVQRMTVENATLKQRVRQLSTENRTLDERLKAARSNLRFQDRRIADLEARLADPAVRPS